MTDTDTLINRINQETAAEVKRQEAAWAEVALANRERGLRREQLKDPFALDPVAKVRFPKYLASSTRERDGQTYSFVDENTRRQFEQQPAAQRGQVVSHF